MQYAICKHAAHKAAELYSGRKKKKKILELSLVTESISLKAPVLSLPNVCGLHKTYYC